jgi:hypothetical protein
VRRPVRGDRGEAPHARARDASPHLRRIHPRKYR